jgi:hypothetical protein
MCQITVNVFFIFSRAGGLLKSILNGDPGETVTIINHAPTQIKNLFFDLNLI